ncbi:MAG: hypothetical protein IPL87_00315 [Candidatus Moraniibacteriota bacterium]|nr:MAG: hypothetical protein IPL87_00315 [Candidatus Moranbacteria bacterium]
MTLHPLFLNFVAQGVPIDTIRYILMFPLIVTLVAFFRQVVGIKAFGIYTPSIVTFAFLAFDPGGLKYGVAIFVSIILVGMLSRLLLRRLRILYLPRVAISLTIVALAILAILVAGGSLHRTGLASVSIFPLLIMITLVEKFVATQIEKGDKVALMLAGETLFISLVGYFLARSSTIAEYLLAFPWIVLLTIPVNIFLGRWRGLRLSELLRFSKLLK